MKKFGLAALAVAMPLTFAQANDAPALISLDDQQLDIVTAGFEGNFDVSADIDVTGEVVNNSLVFAGLINNINPFTIGGSTFVSVFGQGVGNSTATSNADVVPSAGDLTFAPSVTYSNKVGGISTTFSMAAGFFFRSGLLN